MGGVPSTPRLGGGAWAQETAESLIGAFVGEKSYHLPSDYWQKLLELQIDLRWPSDRVREACDIFNGIGLLGGIINYFAACDDPPKVMLSTHLSEILEDGYLMESSNIKYYTMRVLSPDDKCTDVDDIVFLYRLVPGHALLSYGLHCALLAGGRFS